MSEPTLQQQLRDCARAASAGWAQLIRAWSWTEINQHDDLRRLLVWAIAWASEVGEGRVKLEEGAEGPHLQAIAALTWPGLSTHIVHSVVSCLRTAGNPWIWEMSQARFQHLVASVDLQHAVRAGVNPADIGRDYLELQHLDAKLLA